MSELNPISAIILAAGDGTRMKSMRPKPLHEVGGQSLLVHALRTAETLAPESVTVVVSDAGGAVAQAAAAAAPGAGIEEQSERRGTGHAALSARGALAHAMGDAVILYADTPF
ncbi:MAG: NTP transferase domain-containing protein, partial [Paracoccaceae bacterium]